MSLRALIAFALSSLGLVTACQPTIGDPCLNAFDCSVQRDRQCDRSYLSDGVQGECIIEGCAAGICPSGEDSVCVKVYGTRFASTPCDPDREDIAPPCASDDTCVPLKNAAEYSKAIGECKKTKLPCNLDDPKATANSCATHERCLPEGVCADEVSARTSCRLECTDDEDCRLGYMCQETGRSGVYIETDFDGINPDDQTAICVPNTSQITEEI